MNVINYIDLFSGAGGLSEGFIQCGFSPIAHVEIDKAATFTLKTRTAFHYLLNNSKSAIYYDYLKGKIDRNKLYSNIPSEELDTVINAKIGEDNESIFRQIDSLIKGKDVDLIIGGPPCQAYSIVGRAPLKHRTDDERTKLYIHYGRFLKRYQPKIFVFENVPGLLSAAKGAYYKNLKHYYKRLGYNVEATLLNARDFNVVQNRERVIIIGWKKELNLDYPNFEKSEAKYYRDDIFQDLPVIGCNENSRIHQYSAPPGSYLKETSLRNEVDFVTQHNTRPHNRRDLRIYALAIEKLTSGHRLKNSEIPETMRTQQNIDSFLDRFKVVDKVPHTLIAHISKDGHHFIHPDIKQCRSISIREAARIQSFPDSYYFEGVTQTAFRSAAFKQIGNAVPPLMALKIAEMIKEMFTNG